VERIERGGLPFCRVHQVGVVVRDLQRAMDYYSSLFGIGPFRPLNVTTVDRIIYGNPAPNVSNLSRVTRLGPVQLELIQPISGESIQREFLQRRGEGINHLGFFVEDLEREVAGMMVKGFTAISTGRFTSGGGFAYFDTSRFGGVLFELVQWPPEEDPER